MITIMRTRVMALWLSISRCARAQCRLIMVGQQRVNHHSTLCSDIYLSNAQALWCYSCVAARLQHFGVGRRVCRAAVATQRILCTIDLMQIDATPSSQDAARWCCCRSTGMTVYLRNMFTYNLNSDLCFLTLRSLAQSSYAMCLYVPNIVTSHRHAELLADKVSVSIDATLFDTCKICVYISYLHVPFNIKS